MAKQKVAAVRDQQAAVAYIRVSPGDRQVNGQRVAASDAVSLDLQEERIRAYCLLKGFVLVGIYRDEEISASKPLASRPDGRTMLAALAGGAVSQVITMKFDRMFRDSIDALTNARSFAEQGIGLHFLDLGGQAVDTTSAVGGLIFAMLAATAEMERRVIGERTKAALAYKKSQGIRLGAPSLGTTPQEIETVRYAVELRAQGLTLQAVADRLNAEGRATKRGGSWYAKTVANVIERAGQAA